MKELKKHISIDEQVNLLTSRGLIINDAAKARKFLSNVNYYRLSGYLYSFKRRGSDSYFNGTSLEQIVRIYDFDRKFTRILMFALEDVEETLKCRLSYSLTSSAPDDPLIYLNPRIYRSYGPYQRLLGEFYKEVEHNANLPFIKHHNEEYGGKLPMWVAVEILTMGNLHALYDNLLPVYQKSVAKLYGTGPTQLSSWIRNLTFTRNHLAHYMRIYDYNFGRTPVQCKRHHIYKIASGRIFDQIYIMSFMFSNPCEWNNYVLPEIESLLRTYSDVVKLDCIGFPEDWFRILHRAHWPIAQIPE